MLLYPEGVDTKVIHNMDTSDTTDAIVGKKNNLVDVKGDEIVSMIPTLFHICLR
jgi:hypothetical protein